MEINTAFRILEMEQTKDEEIIAGAYRMLLPKYNPEDDAEGFKNLRMAFETAIDYARATDAEEETASEPKTAIDFWMKKVEALYQDILSRGDLEKWKQLLEDDVCVALDTSIEARDRLLVFLMDNVCLPHEVWKEIADTFQIIEDIDELEEYFPRDFLDYIKYHAENKNSIPFDLFEYKGLDGEDANPDAYIRELLSVKRKIDMGQTEACMDALDNLKDYGIYHAYEDVERLKIYIKQLEENAAEDTAEIQKKCAALIEKLAELPPKHVYAHTYIGEALWHCGQKEQAYAVWKSVLETSPNVGQAKYGVARYLFDKGCYEDADKLVDELLQMHDTDETIQELMIPVTDEALHAFMMQINDVLIETYKNQIARGEENPRHPGQKLILEVGWKLWQNQREDEALELLKDVTPDKDCEYGYYNLVGRLLYYKKEYEKALPYLKRWNELLQDLDGVEPEEKKRRIIRRPMSHSCIAGCLYELSDMEGAEENMKQAIALLEGQKGQPLYMQQYAEMLLVWKRYNDAVDVCDAILKLDRTYYPAYLVHQKACFELGKAQEVVNDYQMAVSIVNNYYRPYLYAALVYYYYGQYQAGADVLKEARENDVEFPCAMMLVDEKIQRRLAEDKKEREKLHAQLEEIAKKLDTEELEEGQDQPSIDEIYCERAYLYWDDYDFENALLWIDKAIRENSQNARYHLIKGDMLSDDANDIGDSRFADAVLCYQEVLSNGSTDNPWVYYSLGYCYERLDNMTEAVSCYEKALEIEAPYENICKRLVDYYLNQYMRTYDMSNLKNAMKYADIEVADEESAYSLYHKARVYEYGTEFDKAVELYEKALQLIADEEEPRVESYDIWQQLGNCYRRLMKFEKAVSCFETSIKKLEGRKRTAPYWNLAICYESMAEYEKAIEYYKQALEYTADVEMVWQNIGDCYRYLRRYDEALEAYDNAEEIDRNANYGEVFYAKGDYKAAEQYYKKSVTKAPKTELASKYILLGDYYLENLQDYKKAISCFEKSKSLSRRESDLLSANVDLVKAYYMQGKYKQAKKYAALALDNFKNMYHVSEEEFLSAAPYRSIELYRFAWIYLGLGDVEKAKRYFHRMEEGTLCRNCKFKGCYEAQLYLGILYYMQGEMDGAEKAFEEASRRNPHDAFSKQMLKKVKNG